MKNSDIADATVTSNTNVGINDVRIDFDADIIIDDSSVFNLKNPLISSVFGTRILLNNPIMVISIIKRNGNNDNA